MEIEHSIEITVRRIANGYLVHRAKHGDCRMAPVPQIYLPTFEHVLDALPVLAAETAELTVDENSEHHF
jgi:hypothetical protein